jgi:protein-disulfide isomerase
LRPGGGAQLLGRSQKYTKLDVSTSDILDSREFGMSEFIVIEFFDYECPPCKSQNKYIQAIIAKYSGKLKYSIRHFPLDKIHSLARKAACIAEAYRNKGRFLEIHDKLMDLPEITKDILDDMGENVDIKDSQLIVDGDVKLGNRLKIDSTPSFVLCTPDGDVYRLKSIRVLKEFLG